MATCSRFEPPSSTKKFLSLIFSSWLMGLTLTVCFGTLTSLFNILAMHISSGTKGWGEVAVKESSWDCLRNCSGSGHGLSMGGPDGLLLSSYPFSSISICANVMIAAAFFGPSTLTVPSLLGASLSVPTPTGPSDNVVHGQDQQGPVFRVSHPVSSVKVRTFRLGIFLLFFVHKHWRRRVRGSE